MSFRTTFLFIAFAELLSLISTFYPEMNIAGFFVICIIALVLSFKKLEYGLLFVLAELVLGSKGYLFSFELFGTLISIRMALFVIVMGAWVGKVISTKTFIKKNDFKILRWWGYIGIAIMWGLLIGYSRGNNFGDLFLDANGYFYTALILPFIWVIGNTDKDTFWKNIWIVFFASTTWIAIETILLVYFWTHGLNNYIAANIKTVYTWIRDTGVGEITWLEGNFARVFFQSHIFNVVAFFLLIISKNLFSRNKTYILLTLNTAVILVSLSRSFWVGMIVGLFVLIIFAIKNGFLKKFVQRLLIGIIFAIMLLFIVARFPLPRPHDSDLSFLQDRARLKNEAAAVSRWNLLPVITNASLEHSIVGSGFGKTIIYISNDPRVREVSINGEYTTYAFEWGWIDIWLKLGIVGIIAYVGLVISLVVILYKKKRFDLVAMLFALSAIHFFTPYLNHPLGIGVLILGSIVALRE